MLRFPQAPRPNSILVLNTGLVTQIRQKEDEYSVTGAGDGPVPIWVGEMQLWHMEFPACEKPVAHLRWQPAHGFVMTLLLQDLAPQGRIHDTPHGRCQAQRKKIGVAEHPQDLVQQRTWHIE